MEINLAGLQTFLKGQSGLNCSVALVKDIIIDNDEVLYKVELQPTLETPLVRASWDYVGNGFGMYVLPEIEDEILCLFPNGDMNRGICIKRLNNGIDKIPSGIVSNKIILIAKEGYSVDATIKGGNVNITVEGNINVEASGIVNIKAEGNVNVDGANINLNGHGPGVARIGDTVVVSCGEHGSHSGTITAGSGTVFCGD